MLPASFKKQEERIMVTAIEPQVADTGKYSTKEAYEALGVSRSAFAAYVAQGRIKYGERRGQKDRMGRPRKFFTGRAIKMFWRTL